jgi:membrane-bound lytic murein transglycosylase
MANAVQNAGSSIGSAVSKMGIKDLQKEQLNGVKFDNALKVLELQKGQMEIDAMQKATQTSPRQTPNPMNELKGFDSEEMSNKVGEVYSELYQLARVPYSYVKKQMASDNRYWQMPITKVIQHILRSFESDYKQTTERNPKKLYKD